MGEDALGSEGLGLGFDVPAEPSNPSPANAAVPYRVLARKYRPSNFADLIGQEAMVKTLSNAFALNRIHQAYILTGVRGVGKTTTARILARAFNYELPAKDGQAAINQPTIDMREMGVHCEAIIASRHVDVIEMDAASHTGIDDVREIIESARYKPVMARTKVYIIDEVHMLSKQAFNGLLKTLEEPPDHVKFLFATTEIDKVPVTIRSRCQRFDLRRVEAQVLVAYLASLCMKESVAIEEAALASIARAAEGSVRDALSLLDQAIAHGMGDAISKASVNTMLGLADRGKIIDLFETVMSGNMASALALIKDLYDSGADPAQVLIELAEFVHLLTRFKLVPAAAKDMSLTEDERQRGAEFAASLGVPILTRAWQILLKGLQEVKGSDRPLAAAEMVLVRLAYAADLPTPDEVLRELKGLPPQVKPEAARPGPSPARPSPNSEAKLKPAEALQPKLAAAASPKASLALAPLALTSIAAEGENDQPRRRYHSFSDIVALAGERRDLQLKRALEQDVHLVRFEEGAFEFSPGPGASPGLAQALSRKLAEWTGFRWIVALSREKGAPSLQQMAEAQTEDEMALARRDPLVQSVLKHFPGAEIIAVRPVKQDNILEPSLLPEDEGADEIGFADMIEPDDDL